MSRAQFAAGRLLARMLVAGLAAAAPLALAACPTPSADVDGGDLLGAYDRDAAAPAQADAAQIPASTTPTRPSGEAATKAAPRAAGAGVCVTPAEGPAPEVRRTLGRPACRGAEVLEWRDPTGAPRYGCVTAPPGVAARVPLPLLVFFHAPFENPTAVDKRTGLRKLGASFRLGGDPTRAGFLILAVQGRSIGERVGGSFDTAPRGENQADVATVDHFIDLLEARGWVDRRRIYAVGASEGGQMAAAYAMIRADRVAAFATYASAGPHATWSCPGPPPPGMVIYRACDELAPCEGVERWLRAREASGAETVALRLGDGLQEEPHCAFRKRCSVTRGTANHRRWPKPQEEDLLQFFARHALPAQP